MNNDITTCPNCAMPISKGLEECPNCGYLQGSVRCPYCGNPIGENDDVCKYCGGDLSK